jgi:hypothetical protein
MAQAFNANTGVIVPVPRVWQLPSQPTITSDSAHGFAAGDRWISTGTPQIEWACLDATVGSASWFAIGPGQYASRVINGANGIALTSGVTVNIAQVLLPAGRWDLMGELWISVTSGTPNLQSLIAALTPTSAAIPADPSDLTAVNWEEPQQPRTGAGTGAVLPVVGPWLNLASPTQYFLVASVTWTGTGTCVGYGMLGGRFFPTVDVSIAPLQLPDG